VAMVRYSRASPPDLILPVVPETEALRTYARQFWRLDPFQIYWASGGSPGVVRLRALARGIARTRYAREFLSAMRIHDEIAVFLPPIGDVAPTLLMDRASRPFTAPEVARVQALWPLLAALHRSHVARVVSHGGGSKGQSLGLDRATRLVDRAGNEIWVTDAWKAEADQPEVAEAIAVISARGPCTIALPRAQIARRTQFPKDFGPAPGGFLDEIFSAFPDLSLPSAMASRLTERERQVVMLTLQGHPIARIAERLDLTRGTVKNHRLSIYRKLDITTERELFTEVIAAARAQEDP
jgi:DNA-binding CsgD family transcriptional regulator